MFNHTCSLHTCVCARLRRRRIRLSGFRRQGIASLLGVSQVTLFRSGSVPNNHIYETNAISDHLTCLIIPYSDPLFIFKCLLHLRGGVIGMGVLETSATVFCALDLLILGLRQGTLRSHLSFDTMKISPNHGSSIQKVWIDKNNPHLEKTPKTCFNSRLIQ